MKIIEMPPYYFPEKVASSHLTRDLTEGLVSNGFEIENYVPTPCRGISDKERLKYKKIKKEELFDGKVKIMRFSMWKEGKNPILRTLRYTTINIIQGIKCGKIKDADLIIGGSTPPIQGLLCSYVAKRISKNTGKKIPFLYMLHDVFPDSLVTTGLAKKDGIIWKLGRLIENKIYKEADKIVVISENIKQNIMQKGVEEEKITVITNWIDLKKISPIAKRYNTLFNEFNIPKDKFIVLYAGNLGFAQGATVIVEAANELRKYKEIYFVMFGNGCEYEKIENKIRKYGLTNISLNPLLSIDRVSEVYSMGDVNLITCKKGVGNSGLPSKTWSILACDKRIIASFDKKSELSKILYQSDCGVCVEPENYIELSNAILKEYQCKGNPNKRSSPRQFVSEYASKEICVGKYIKEIKELLEDR